MSITRPRGEQLLFSSRKTGDHSLDTYLEACEKGTKTIGDMLDQIFGDNGQFSSDIYEFRENPSFAGRLQVRINTTIDPLSDWADATTKAAEAAASAASAATSEGLATTASNSVNTNLPAINQAIANAASINFPTPTALDFGKFLSVAEGGGAIIFKKAEGGSKPYVISPTSPATYIVKKLEFVTNNFTPSDKWQVASHGVLWVSDLATIVSDGNYIEATKTISSTHLFYDDLQIMDGITVTLSGTAQGVSLPAGSSAAGSSTVDTVRSRAELYFFGAI